MNRIATIALAGASALFAAGTAGAATTFLESVQGNDPFGSGITVDGVFSASLAKCDTDFESIGTSDCDLWEEGASDGTYTSNPRTDPPGTFFDSAFSVNYSGENAFSWSFMPGEVQGELKFPLFIAVKTGAGGPGRPGGSYELFGLTGNHTSRSIDYADFAGEDGFPDTFGAISHVSFYNGDAPNPIPLPAAGWLLVAGVGGLAALRRRKG